MFLHRIDSQVIKFNSVWNSNQSSLFNFEEVPKPLFLSWGKYSKSNESANTVREVSGLLIALPWALSSLLQPTPDRNIRRAALPLISFSALAGSGDGVAPMVLWHKEDQSPFHKWQLFIRSNTLVQRCNCNRCFIVSSYGINQCL